MKNFLLFADRVHLPVTAPAVGAATGGTINYFENMLHWCSDWAPFFSVLAAVTGIVIGFITLILRLYDRRKNKRALQNENL